MSDLALDQAFSIGMGETPVRFPTPLDRLIHLRTLPNLGGLEGSALTYIATHAEERHFEVGDHVYLPEERVTAVHFIVEGKVRVEQEGVHILDGEPPYAIGFMPVLASSEVGQKALVVEPTVTLEVSAADLFEIFEDDFAFLENGIRRISAQFTKAQEELECRGLLERSEPEETPYPTKPLDLVERLELFLSGPFALSNLEPLVQMVRLAEEVRYEPGDVLWEQGDVATWGLTVAHGVVSCESNDRSFRMGPGSTVGIGEANGQLPRSYRAVAETRVVGLKQTTEVLLDVLEDNPEMAMGMLSFLSRLMLDFSIRLAQAKHA